MSVLTLVAACSAGGGPKSGTVASVRPVGACPVSASDAGPFLGGTPNRVGSLPGLPTLPAPITRCEYASGPSQLQVTVFAGSGLLAQLKILAGSNATALPGVAPASGYCGGGQGTVYASYACVFTRAGDTYVVALVKPDAQDLPTLHQQLEGLSQRLATG